MNVIQQNVSTHSKCPCSLNRLACAWSHLLFNRASEGEYLGHKCLPLPGSGNASVGFLQNLTVQLPAFFVLDSSMLERSSQGAHEALLRCCHQMGSKAEIISRPLWSPVCIWCVKPPFSGRKHPQTSQETQSRGKCLYFSQKTVWYKSNHWFYLLSLTAIIRANKCLSPHFIPSLCLTSCLDT